jgi:tetratricopeptide (TPR) repeat protein
VLWVAGAALLVALAIVQTASYSIFSNEPSRGVAIYGALARIAPAPYVRDMLARAAYARREYGQAAAQAERIPQTAQREEWLGRIAVARGNVAAARAHFLNAGDDAAISVQAVELARTDLPAAIALESALRARLQRASVHPDAVAEASWRLGTFYAQAGRRTRALEEYRRATAISPLNVKYLLAAGTQAYELHLRSEARSDFQRAVNADPSAADARALLSNLQR